MTRWPLGPWLSLSEAARITGLSEDLLLDRALTGVVRAQMHRGEPYLVTEDVVALLVGREASPQGCAWRLRGSDPIAEVLR